MADQQDQVSASEPQDNPDIDVPASIAHYDFSYRHGANVDFAADKEMREIFLEARLPKTIARQLHAAVTDPANTAPRPPGAAELANRSAEFRLKERWGEAEYPAKMAAFNSVFKDTLPREKLEKVAGWFDKAATGTNQLLITQLVTLGERRAAAKKGG